MKQSNFLSLNFRDALRSFLVALFSFIAYYIQDTWLPGLDIPEEVKVMISAAIGYLTKNFVTKPDSESKGIIGDRPKDR